MRLSFVIALSLVAVIISRTAVVLSRCLAKDLQCLAVGTGPVVPSCVAVSVAIRTSFRAKVGGGDHNVIISHDPISTVEIYLL